MDASGRVTILCNRKGMALVHIAVLLLVLIGFAGLVIDLGYMYVAKAQLQNAADAAALAGATALPSLPTGEATARSLAQTAAQNNSAAGKPVSISPADITFGRWSSTIGYQQGVTPYNAIKVMARRDSTTTSSDGPIDLIIGRAFGFSQMGARASAVAQLPLRAGAYFTIPLSVCTGATGGATRTFSPALQLVIGPAIAGSNQANMGWTTFGQSNTNAADVKAAMDQSTYPPDAAACGSSIYTTQGNASVVFGAMETNFYTMSYDAVNKSIGTVTVPIGNGNNTYTTSTVTGWRLYVPVVYDPNPGTQPNPMGVWGYAYVTLTKACGGPSHIAPIGLCNNSDDSIYVGSISCLSCAESESKWGKYPSLVSEGPSSP